MILLGKKRGCTPFRKYGEPFSLRLNVKLCDSLITMGFTDRTLLSNIVSVGVTVNEMKGVTDRQAGGQ